MHPASPGHPESWSVLVSILCGLHNRWPLEAQAFAHWFPAGGAVWGSLGGAALLEEMCHRGWALCPTSSGCSFTVLCLRLKIWSLRVPISHHACSCRLSSPSGWIFSLLYISLASLRCLVFDVKQWKGMRLHSQPERPGGGSFLGRPLSLDARHIRTFKSRREITRGGCCAKPEVDTVNNWGCQNSYHNINGLDCQVRPCCVCSGDFKSTSFSSSVSASFCLSVSPHLLSFPLSRPSSHPS